MYNHRGNHKPGECIATEYGYMIADASGNLCFPYDIDVRRPKDLIDFRGNKSYDSENMWYDEIEEYILLCEEEDMIDDDYFPFCK